MWTIIQLVFQWLFIIILILSLIIFIGFYLRGAFRDRIRYKVIHAPRPEDPEFPFTLASITNSFVTQGVITDFWNEVDAIQQARIDAISKAEYTIDFETFFMTPGKRADDFAAAIAKKASEGVKVRLVIDHYGTKKGGVEIYEYQPSMTHAKLLLIDDRWATTGSANFAPRSFCHNEELDICSAQPKLVEGIRSTFEKGFAQSQRVTDQDWQQRSLIKHRMLGNMVDFFQWQL
ncbi:MAG: phospholipase D-like domain-containing protein [Xenococcaceae cyanobacterium]